MISKRLTRSAMKIFRESQRLFATHDRPSSVRDKGRSWWDFGAGLRRWPALVNQMMRLLTQLALANAVGRASMSPMWLARRPVPSVVRPVRHVTWHLRPTLETWLSRFARSSHGVPSMNGKVQGLFNEQIASNHFLSISG